MLKAVDDNNTLSAAVESRQRARSYFAARPAFAKLTPDPKDPIHSAMDSFRCAYSDLERFLTRRADAEELTQGPLHEAWLQTESEYQNVVTAAIDELVRTVPTTWRGVFELLEFWNRELDQGLVAEGDKHRFGLTLETALLSLNGNS